MRHTRPSFALSSLYKGLLVTLSGLALVACEFSSDVTHVPLAEATDIRFSLGADADNPMCADYCATLAPLISSELSGMAIDVYELDVDNQPLGEPLVTLRDDGLNGDETAADGVLSGIHTFYAEADGLTRVQGFAQGTAFVTDVLQITLGDYVETFSLQQQLELGLALYSDNCSICHGASGEGGFGSLMPALSANTSVTATDPAALIDFIVQQGCAGGSLPWGSLLADRDLSAVLTYIRNSLGNDVGDVIQPADIAAAR